MSHPHAVRRVGLFGFSAGAYAVLELLSVLQVPCGAGLGGLHGHGASAEALSALPKKRRHRMKPYTYTSSMAYICMYMYIGSINVYGIYISHTYRIYAISEAI